MNPSKNVKPTQAMIEDLKKQISRARTMRLASLKRLSEVATEAGLLCQSEEEAEESIPEETGAQE